MEFFQAIDSMLPIPPVEKGCLERELYQHISDANHICCLEYWKTQPELQTYLDSDKFQAVLGAMTVLGDIVDCKVITAETVEKMAPA